MSGCSLCDLERLTKWYVSDPRFIICDCLTCGTPMIVYRLHGVTPSIEEQQAMLELARKVLKNEKLVFRGYARQIQKEQHWHE